MADLSITPGSVRGYGDRFTGIAGGTITAGMQLKINTSNQLVAASSDSALNAAVVGMALNGASVNQPVEYQKGGLIDPGATVAIGKVYVLGTASGTTKPVDDIAGTEYVTVVGVGTAANRIRQGVIASGVIAAAAVT